MIFINFMSDNVMPYSQKDLYSIYVVLLKNNCTRPTWRFIIFILPYLPTCGTIGFSVYPPYVGNQFFSTASSSVSNVPLIVVRHSPTNLLKVNDRPINLSLFSVVHGIGLPAASKKFSHLTMQKSQII